MVERERGLCFCGCGQNAPIAKENDSRRGNIKGQPVKYIRGHRQDIPDHSYTVAPNGCWEFNKAPNSNGYAHFYSKGKRTLAHRFYYQLVNGPIPDGLFVCHKCDNPRCINPDHMFLGTQADNMRDCVEKGRRQRGEDHYKAGLTAESVTDIRLLYQLGNFKATKVGRMYNSTRTAVRCAAQGRSWKHVPFLFWDGQVNNSNPRRIYEHP